MHFLWYNGIIPDNCSETFISSVWISKVTKSVDPKGLSGSGWGRKVRQKNLDRKLGC